MTFPRYSAYKDSAVRWIGEVPADWKVSSLKHIFSIVGGSTPKSDNKDFWEGEYVWITPADLSGLSGLEVNDSERRITAAGLASCGTRLVPPGSIVLSTRAPIGSLAIAGTTLCTNQGCKSLIAKEVCSPRFFAYLLSVATEELNVRGRGTTFLELSTDALGAVEAVVPSVHEQHAIAAFLDRETSRIDALLSEQERLLELLTEKRQAVISHAVTKGLNFNAPMRESGVVWLGRVPAHWAVVPLKRCLSDIKAGPFGSALTKDMYVDSGYRVYGQEQVIPADFSVGDYYVDEQVFRELRQYQVTPGDVLISCVGTFGKVAVVPAGIEAGVINPRLLRLRCSQAVSPDYLVELLRSSSVFEQMSSASRGGTMDTINAGTLGKVWVALPPPEEQADIIQFVRAEFQRIEALTDASRRAASLIRERRVALMAAAATGKIDVREVA